MFRCSWARLCAIAALAVATILIGTANVAVAEPAGPPTMGIAELSAKLDAADAAGTPLMGYMATVDKGSTIETIPVQIKSLTEDLADTDNQQLIFFEATGTTIAKFGGIVEGMSGSPIYVQGDDGVWDIVGAVSYGDMFTLGGTGLATPIEQMLQLAVDYAPRVQSLEKPVMVSGRLVDKVVIPTNPGAYKTPSQAAGAFVGKPLSSIYIGGINPNGKLFAALKKQLTAHGESVVPLGAPLSAGSSTFSTPLVPGAAVGALYTRGDMWIGALGTVTYADDSNNVLVFGHSLAWDGPTSAYMTNAVITGVWPSIYVPYKMGYPSAIRGEFTQDRNSGLLGVQGTNPDEVPVTAHVTNADTGRSADSSVYFTSQLFDAGDTSFYASYAASVAGYKLFDQQSVSGSAVTTTTVVVSDNTGTYTVVIPNMVDDSSDLPGYIADDVSNAVYSIQALLDDGIVQPHIESIHVEATLTGTRRTAEVVDVKPKTSLHVGDNTIDVSLLAYGVADTQTVETTLTIPAGTPVSGELVASGYTYSDSSDSESYSIGSDGSVSITFGPSSDSWTYSRESLADVVKDLNTSLPNNTLFVSFYPESNADSSDDGSAPSADSTPSIDTTLVVPWTTDGQAQVTAAELTAFTDPIQLGEDAEVTGEVFGPSKPVTVSIYGTPAGSTVESLLATDTTYVDPDTDNMAYDIIVPELYSNTSLRVHIDGTADYSAADTNVMQLVRAYVSIKTSSKSVKYGKKVTLTASVIPGECTGNVTFQYYDASRRAWRTIGTRSLVSGLSSARATLSWAPLKGSHKVRVVYGGCALNYGNSSGSVTIAAK